MIIGLTGTTASGKGFIADLLIDRGFKYSSTSDRIREEAENRGLKNYKLKDLQDIGNELRQEYGLGVLAKMTIGKLNGIENCIIDGIRNLGEINTLKSYDNFVLIAVDSDEKIRYDRLIKRARPSDPKTWEEFLKMNKRDLGIEKEADIKNGQQVKACMEKADYVFINNYSTKEKAEKEFLIQTKNILNLFEK